MATEAQAQIDKINSTTDAELGLINVLNALNTVFGSHSVSMYDISNEQKPLLSSGATFRLLCAVANPVLVRKDFWTVEDVKKAHQIANFDRKLTVEGEEFDMNVAIQIRSAKAFLDWCCTYGIPIRFWY